MSAIRLCVSEPVVQRPDINTAAALQLDVDIVFDRDSKRDKRAPPSTACESGSLTEINQAQHGGASGIHRSLEGAVPRV